MQRPFANTVPRFLVRAGSFDQAEGTGRSRHVVLEFADYEMALPATVRPNIRRPLALRQGKAELDLIVCEGYAGPPT